MNSFGNKYRINIFGESHGKSIGVLIDGCPVGIPLSENDFTADLLRRKSGAKGTTPRIEDEKNEHKHQEHSKLCSKYDQMQEQIT